MVERDSLQPVLQRGANPHQPPAIPQQCDDLATCSRGHMDSWEIASYEQIQHQRGITTIILLPSSRQLPDRKSISYEQGMAQLFDQLVEPQGVPGGLDANHSWGRKTLIKAAYLIALVVQPCLVNLSLRCVDPTDALVPCLQIDSQKNPHVAPPVRQFCPE